MKKFYVEAAPLPVFDKPPPPPGESGAPAHIVRWERRVLGSRYRRRSAERLRDRFARAGWANLTIIEREAE